MNDAWEKTIAGTNRYLRYEYGFYIYLENGEIEAGNMCNSSKGNQCDDEIDNLTIIGSGDPGNSDYGYIIGIFHTHPPLTGCPGTTKRICGESSSDIYNLERRKIYIPAFVYDYLGTIQGGHDENLPAKVYSYGADRRELE
jgi:hypothetical protein